MGKTAKLKLKSVRLDAMRPNPWNPNEMSDKLRAKLRAEMERHGYLVPIVVRPADKKGNYEIVDGEQRWRELKDSGTEVADVVITDLDDTEARVATINLNELKGTWDEEKLSDLLQELEPIVEEPLADVLPFREAKIAKLLSDVGEPYPQVPEIPDVQREVDIEEGDLLKLGRHRVLCGDSSNLDDLRALLGKKKVRVCVTSPPYFNLREYSQWDSYSEYHEFIKSCAEALLKVAGKPFALCWNIMADIISKNCIPADHYRIFKDLGYQYEDHIAWVKDAILNVPRASHIEKGHYYPLTRWESIFVFSRGKLPAFDVRDMAKVKQFRTDVWDMRTVHYLSQEKVGHPAIYPVEIPRRCIMAYSKAGETVLDPFGGSGQSLFAAEYLDRTCYIIEKSPQYCDVIRRRWEDLEE